MSMCYCVTSISAGSVVGWCCQVTLSVTILFRSLMAARMMWRICKLFAKNATRKNLFRKIAGEIVAGRVGGVKS
nr:hypothetical protein [Neisseria subflava]